MNRKGAVIGLSFVFVFSFIVIFVEIAPVVEAPKTWYVDDVPGSGGPGDPPENFTSIQDAINASKDGDTVFVYNGTYYENVVVNKTINLIGEDRDNTTICVGGIGDVIKVSADSVKIMGFNITNAVIGIDLRSSNCYIANNICSNNKYGIYISASSNNNVTGNTVSNNYFGIYFYHSSNNNVTNNTVSNNWYSIYLLRSSNKNTITKNSLLGNLIAIYATDSINIDARYNYFGTSYHHRLEKLIYSSVGGGVNYSNWLWYRESKVQYVDGTISWTSPIILNEGVIVNGTLTISTEVTFNNVYGQNFILVNGTLNICNANFLSNTGQYSILYLNNTEGNIINSTFVGQKYLGSHRQGFDICDSTFISGGVGVALWRAMNNNITGNNISNNYDGIYLEYSSNNSLKENNASSNNMYGLVLRHSIRNTIDNNIYSSNYYGIALYYSSDYNIIVDNICSDNNPHGIFIYDSSNNNIVTNNTCLSNYWEGIRISYSKNNTISNNKCSYNEYHGIWIVTSNNGMVVSNTCYQNGWSGIRLHDNSNDNIITDNNVLENPHGIHIGYSYNNQIYHNNLINNANQAYDNTNNGNQWDDGYPSGGNYWSDFDEPSEGAYDDYKGPDQLTWGNDGIVDNGTIAGGGKNPYVIDSDSQDNYPLISPYQNYMILKQGWNLISLPLIQQEQNLTKVLASIDGLCDGVQWYDITDTNDPWKHYKVGKPYGNDLSKINETMGFWIHITQPGDTIFLYNGTQPTSNQTITLHPGWNLVGYPSLRSHNRTNGLNNLTFGQEVDSIWTYDAATQKWKDIGPSDYFELGRGYWVHAKIKCVWEVPL